MDFSEACQKKLANKLRSSGLDFRSESTGAQAVCYTQSLLWFYSLLDWRNFAYSLIKLLYFLAPPFAVSFSLLLLKGAIPSIQVCVIEVLFPCCSQHSAATQLCALKEVGMCRKRFTISSVR